ncbi:MAG: transcriptional repressor [Nitrospirae bacterium]|nr:transcriptional repressor [Nitrospirota bacterium]
MYKFKDIGLKLTPQRLAILDFLDGNTDHPSADDIYKAVSVQHPTMSFATVYNTLDTLRGKGQILELTIDPGKKRFDPCTDPHHHLICTSCRRVLDINMTFNLDLPEDVSGEFRLTGNHIEFYGICPACKDRN